MENDPLNDAIETRNDVFPAKSRRGRAHGRGIEVLLISFSSLNYQSRRIPRPPLTFNRFPERVVFRARNTNHPPRIPPLYLGIDVSSAGIDRPRTGRIALRPCTRRGIKTKETATKRRGAWGNNGRKANGKIVVSAVKIRSCLGGKSDGMRLAGNTGGTDVDWVRVGANYEFDTCD